MLPQNSETIDRARAIRAVVIRPIPLLCGRRNTTVEKAMETTLRIRHASANGEIEVTKDIPINGFIF